MRGRKCSKIIMCGNNEPGAESVKDEEERHETDDCKHKNAVSLLEIYRQVLACKK